MMKKMFALLLALMMLLTAGFAFAESVKEMELNNQLLEFLRKTDLKTQDLAVQIQSGDQEDDLVFRVDGYNLHMVMRENGVEKSHIQLNPTGIYLGGKDAVILMRPETFITVEQDILKEVDAIQAEIEKSIPAEAIPSDAEVMKSLNQISALAADAVAREQADAATISSAALAFAEKFNPEKILDVKGEPGSMEISLRSEAYAAALGEAMDELISNKALADVMDRRAARKGGKSFDELQKAWAENKEAALEAIRTIQESDKIDENGHWVSHFQIGEEAGEDKPLVCDTDTWINAEDNQLMTTAQLGLKDEDPLMVYEFMIAPDFHREKLTAGDSMAEIQFDFENHQMSRGRVLSILNGQEELRADFAPDYLFIKGPKGSISTTVRETWTGKTRYELYAENAEGKEASLTIDFYEDGDSIVSEMRTSESDQSALFKISRIDKVNIDDLSASENIIEITAEMIEKEMLNILQQAFPAPVSSAETEPGK